ncbi:MAG TPA: DoxX family protein [Acidobacteriota bacterium]|nr:DoxX family protein [Acidobacteriota bacterium]
MNQPKGMSKGARIASWCCRILAALILLQTLFFKFTGAEESIYIFKQVGMEPWGRIGSGIAELIAAGLLILTSTAWLGALLGLGVMVGAIGSHLTVLGIEVQGDGGLLFGLALVVFLCCAVVLYLHRHSIPLGARKG